MQGYRFEQLRRWSNRRLTFTSKAIIISAMLRRILVVDSANDNNNDEA